MRSRHGALAAVLAVGVAVALVLPLILPLVWSGFRLAGHADVTLQAISAFEQPLSVRSLPGVWGLVLALVWFSLAYGRRCVASWEVALVLLGGAALVIRLGNAWLDGLALIAPLARQIGALPLHRTLLGGLAALGGALAVVGALTDRPPELPAAAVQAARAAHSQGAVFTDSRWAASLQTSLGDRAVLGAEGLAGASHDYWTDYLRISQGHERWADLLRRYGADLVVLEDQDAQRAAADLIRADADWRVDYDTQGVLVAERRT